MPNVGEFRKLHSHGRTVIYSDAEAITPMNVIDELKTALETHRFNSDDADYLYGYYKGEQDVLYRVAKESGSDICNKVVVNLANEIVSFKTSYLLYQPIQYVNIDDTKQTEEGLEAVNRLNREMERVGKAAVDKEMTDWMYITGHGYRFVYPMDGELYVSAPDPRCTFVVYSSEIPHKPLMGVFYVTRNSGDVIYNVYTSDAYYRIESRRESMNPYDITEYKPLYLHGRIPVIEYPANMSRLGAFEIVKEILDALNETTSDRVDAIQNYVHSLLAITGAAIEDEDKFWASVRANRGVTLPEGATIQYLSQELGQDGVQTMVDYMIDEVLRIVGMPQRTGGSSTSDNGIAVVLRDGWSGAESSAKATELTFKKSERTFLRIATDILRTISGLDVDPEDVDIRFGRNNYENIQSKAQVLTTMLSSDKIAPKLAFEHCGMFNDPALAYTESKKYMDENEAKAQKELNDLTQMRTKSGLDGSEEEEADV